MRLTKFISFLLAGIVLSLLPKELDATTDFDQGKSFNEIGHILSHRERVEPINRIVKDRLENLLPRLYAGNWD